MSSNSSFSQGDVNMCMAYPGLRIIHHPDGTKSLSYHSSEPVQQEQIELIEAATFFAEPPSPRKSFLDNYGAHNFPVIKSFNGMYIGPELQPVSDPKSETEPAAGGGAAPKSDSEPAAGGGAASKSEPEPAATGGEAPKPKHKPAGKRIPCPEFTDLSDEEKQTWLRHEVREAIHVPFEGLDYLLTLDNKGRRKSPRNIFLNSLGMTRLETINLQQCIVGYGRKKAEIVLANVKEIING